MNLAQGAFAGGQWIWIAGFAVGCLLASRRLIHWFQLESYQFPGYFRTVKRNWRHSLLPGVCAAIWLVLASALYDGIVLTLFAEKEMGLLNFGESTEKCLKSFYFTISS